MRIAKYFIFVGVFFGVVLLIENIIGYFYTFYVQSKEAKESLAIAELAIEIISEPIW